VAADAEEDQAAAHEQRERGVDDLDRAATAAAAEIEQHDRQGRGGALGRPTSSSSCSSSSSPQNQSSSSRMWRFSKTRASSTLSSKRTTSGAIAMSIVTGSGVGVATAATTAIPRITW